MLNKMPKLNVEEMLQEIELFCEKGWKSFPNRLIYKGEEYHICTGDCQSCGVPELIRLLKAMLKDKKIVKREAPYGDDVWRDPFG